MEKEECLFLSQVSIALFLRPLSRINGAEIKTVTVHAAELDVPVFTDIYITLVCSRQEFVFKVGLPSAGARFFLAFLCLTPQ